MTKPPNLLLDARLIAAVQNTMRAPAPAPVQRVVLAPIHPPRPPQQSTLATPRAPLRPLTPVAGRTVQSGLFDTPKFQSPQKVVPPAPPAPVFSAPLRAGIPVVPRTVQPCAPMPVFPAPLHSGASVVPRTTQPSVPAPPVPISPVVSATLNQGGNIAAQALPVFATASIKPESYAPKPTASSAKKARKPASEKPKVDLTAKALKSLDMTSVREMLLCVPSGHVDCRTPVSLISGKSSGFRGLFLLRRTGQVQAEDKFRNEVLCHPYPSIFEAPYKGYWSRIARLQVELVDEAGNFVWLSVFNPWRMKDENPVGTILIEGELQQFGKKMFLKGGGEPPPDVAGKVWVRYVCAGAPSESVLRGLVEQALSDPQSIDDAAHALITSSLLSEATLLDVAAAAGTKRYKSLHEFFMDLHQPRSPEDGIQAAIAARAMGVAGICNAAKVSNFRQPQTKAPINISTQVIDKLIADQPETLTSDQAQAIAGIVKALRAPNPLNGLLSGDVGTGKTLTFLIPAVAAHLAGRRVAIISPTEILANQVTSNISKRFKDIPIERVIAGGKIKNPQAILIGTSGLGSVARKAGYVPDFLIIDEQHKLATKDRNSMMGAWTHQLEASATPIPRSLASTMFSGMQVFNLIHAPVVRQIESFILDESSRSQAVSWMRQAISANSRVAVIYPRVQATERASEAKEGDQADVPASSATDKMVGSVNDAAKALETHFPGRVGKLHGRMAPGELVTALEKFKDGQTPLVVASTVMETGIDVPDIRLLIVKDADRFGAAQLHQLRGRMARNGGHARFVMMVSNHSELSPDTASRLETVKTVSDGYALAEADMASRGFGDLAGNTQSGNISCAFRLLKLCLDDFQSISESKNAKG